MALQLITTKDGSHSLLNPELNETYHSVHGAIQESLHVFIRHGLDHRLGIRETTAISLLEVGFGTGLNALLTLNWAIRAGVSLQYVSLESNPVDPELVRELNYPAMFPMESGANYFQKLHQAAWDEATQLHPDFTLEKRKVLLEEAVLGNAVFDIVFFDAFAPSRQPELWEPVILAKIYDSLKQDGIFVTYCAKGQLKRDLKSLGFMVETLAGPPGKKEMVRATKGSDR